MEDNEKKQCPFCGAEINKQAKKCRFCNNWIDEEIECPFCAEKIKASAKKCRFCGEWLPGNNEEQEEKKEIKEKKSFQIKSFFNNKRLVIYLSALLVVIVVAVLLISIFVYVPKCNSKGITNKLQEYLVVKYPAMANINITKNGISTVRKNKKGYTCSASATVDDVPTHIEYSYTKVSMNDYNFDTKIVLPNCFDSQVKLLLSDIVKKSDYYSIKETASDVVTKYETLEKFDKETPSYQCTAEAQITAKPGKAFMLNYWSYDDASRQIKCKVDYKTYFCENGFTTCVGVKDIYSCENKED